MAQRAYRQRKETTLDDLRKRVSDLTTTVECMNKAFGDCRDRLTMTGLSVGQLDDLAETTVRFAGYMSNVRNPGDSHDEDAMPEPVLPVSTNNDTSNTLRHTEDLSMVPKNVPSWIDKSTLGQTGRQNQQPDVGMGYTLYTPGVFDQMAENFSIPTMAHAMHPRSYDVLPGFPLEPTAPNLHQRSLSASGELALPRTYSFHEKTLARRLHRACLEAAYHLLLDPVRKPHTYERVFKLSLLSRDRVRMAASLKKILDRGLDDPLEFWDAPLLHIGGAGTHYPLRGRPSVAQDQQRPKFHLGTIGPQILNLLDNVVQARPAAEISVEIEGFEGTWFDPYDVEGYLESKGIHIDPTVSFVEAEVTDPPPAESSTASSHSSTHTASMPQTKTTSPTWDNEQWSEMQRLEADMVRWQDMDNVQLSGLGNVGFSDANTGSWMNFQSGDQNQQKMGHMGNSLGQLGMDGFESGLPRYEPPAMSQKKVVIIDVAKFIKGKRSRSKLIIGTEADQCS